MCRTKCNFLTCETLSRTSVNKCRFLTLKAQNQAKHSKEYNSRITEHNRLIHKYVHVHRFTLTHVYLHKHEKTHTYTHRLTHTNKLYLYQLFVLTTTISKHCGQQLRQAFCQHLNQAACLCTLMHASASVALTARQGFPSCLHVISSILSRHVRGPSYHVV